MFGLSYWFLPLFAGLVWLGTLLGMLIRWEVEGRPHYPEMAPTQNIAYISDIGASYLKPLFIAGSATMAVVFDLTFISERWLRHKGRLAHNYGWGEKVLSLLAILAAVVGAAGLILLSVFDTRRHPTIHNAMLVVFIAGYVVSAIFICAEYQRLGIRFREYAILRTSFWIKLWFIFIEVGLAIAFGVLEYQGHYNKSAVLEWTIALIYIFYVWSFIIDFLPAVQTKHRESRFPPVRRNDDEMAMNTQAQGNLLGGPVFSSGGHDGHHGGSGDGSSYGSQQPIANGGRFYPPHGDRAAARNF